MWEWRKGVIENMERVALRVLEREGEEVDVLMERVDAGLDREEMLEWDWWW